MSQKPKEITWLKKLDPGEVSEALEDACVDCYDDSEQHSGLTEMVNQELAFPFSAEVLGEQVEVLGASQPKWDSQGLDLIVVHNGKQYAIAAHCVELRKPLPDGHLFLAAYLDWKSRQ